MNRPALVLSWICFAFSLIGVLLVDITYWSAANRDLPIICGVDAAAWALIALYLRRVAFAK